jgi:high affinity Mn2+ porin
MRVGRRFLETVQVPHLETGGSLHGLRRGTLCSCLSLLILSGLVLASTAVAGEPSPAPVPVPPAPSTGRKLTEFARRVENLFDRVEVTVGVTGVLQGSVGAEEDFADEEDVAAASASVDIELETQFNATWSAFLWLEAGSGGGIDFDLPFLVPANEDASDEESLGLSELWIEGNWRFWGRNWVRLRAGKIDACADLDANEIADDHTTQFLGSGFTCNPTFYAPANDFGAVLEYSWHDLVTLQFSCVDSDSNDEDGVGHDHGGKLFDDLFFTGGVMLSIKPFGMSGNYRAFVWYDDDEFAGVAADTPVGAPDVGFGFSADQRLAEWLTVFVRIGLADEDYYYVNRWASGGLQLSGSLWGRKQDAFGAAWGSAYLGDDFESELRAEDTLPGDEHHWEFYYRWVMNPHMQLSPGLQLVDNPGGDDQHDTMAVFTLRLQVDF